MTLLSRKTDYALLILAYLHQSPVGGTARLIAERYGLSRGFVANILKELCQKGFVVSHRGVKGGYGILRPLEDVSLAELLECLEDRFQLTACTGHVGDDSAAADHDACAVHDTCPIKGPIGELHGRFIELMRRISVADLLGQNLPRIRISSLPMVQNGIADG